MALSNEWWEYHLTPDGWVTGSEKLDFGKNTLRPKPTNAVLTVRKFDRRSSLYSEPVTGQEIIRKSDDKDSIERLKKKFGEWP